MSIANTAVRWNGRVWTMLVAPLPQDEPGRSILLMHEAWHRIQEQIGLKSLNADQPQLATEAGRVSLRLELRRWRRRWARPTRLLAALRWRTP